MSVKAISQLRNSGTDIRSVNSARVKPMLPAPIKAILNDMPKLSFYNVFFSFIIMFKWKKRIDISAKNMDIWVIGEKRAMVIYFFSRECYNNYKKIRLFF